MAGFSERYWPADGPVRALLERLDELREPAVRAAGQVVDALVGAADRLSATEWDELRSALTSILISAGAAPVGLTQLAAGSAENLVGVLAEEFTHRIPDWGEDSGFDAAPFADLVDDRGLDERTLVAALNARGTARHNRFGRHTSHWPADLLAWPYHGEDDLPMAVLDQISRAPSAAVWLIDRILVPFVRRNPRLLPETLTVAWHLAGRDRALLEQVDRLDPHLRAAPGPFTHLRSAAQVLDDQWHRARALLRLALTYPSIRAALVTEVITDATRLTDPVQRFQVLERAALLSGPALRAEQLDVLRELVPRIPGPAGQARALLRLARFLPAPECDAPAIQAIAVIETTDRRADLVTILRLALEVLADRVTVHRAVRRVIDAARFTAPEVATVLDQPAQILDAHLATLLTTPEQAQVWTPVLLYARTAQAARATAEERQRRAWAAVADDPTPESVAALLDLHGQAPIACTGPVARAVDHVAARRPEVMEPLLTRLAHLDSDAEPVVRGWLDGPDRLLHRTAAALLAEYHGRSEELVSAEEPRRTYRFGTPG